ncbi:cation transporter [Candidatus Saccharibacteria bacterium]|nr:cation transporter [Candidatus Saccharibacteria bacterium]
MDNRLQRIYRASWVGIALNLFLVGAKAAVGLISGSVSVLTDAINNATDVFSSLVTLVGTKLAQRKPDKEHPHGHGRIEYLAQVIVGVIILAVGVMAIVQSVPRVENPVVASYSPLTIAVICLSIVLKFIISRYFKRVGKETQSGSLEASGVDAMFDMLLTLGTLVGAVISLIFGISIDGWIGLVISAFIIKTAVEIITDGMTDVIGGRVDEKLVRRIREKIHEHEEVKKINRLTLHEYGPGKTIGAVKIEVKAGMEMREFKKLSEEIQKELMEEFGVELIVGV